MWFPKRWGKIVCALPLNFYCSISVLSEHKEYIYLLPFNTHFIFLKEIDFLAFTPKHINDFSHFVVWDTLPRKRLVRIWFPVFLQVSQSWLPLYLKSLLTGWIETPYSHLLSWRIFSCTLFVFPFRHTENLFEAGDMPMI